VGWILSPATQQTLLSHIYIKAFWVRHGCCWSLDPCWHHLTCFCPLFPILRFSEFVCVYPELVPTTLLRHCNVGKEHNKTNVTSKRTELKLLQQQNIAMIWFQCLWQSGAQQINFLDVSNNTFWKCSQEASEKTRVDSWRQKLFAHAEKEANWCQSKFEWQNQQQNWGTNCPPPQVCLEEIVQQVEEGLENANDTRKESTQHIDLNVFVGAHAIV